MGLPLRQGLRMANPGLYDNYQNNTVQITITTA
jgi:hypothetical protein